MKYTKDFYSIRPNEEIFNRIVEEKKHIGYYRLPFADVTPIVDFARQVNKKHIMVIGIGGSSLGAKAIHDFLRKKYRFERRLFFLESTDPIEIQSQLDAINLKETFFILISKSGGTIETISIFKYLSSLLTFDSNNLAVISTQGTPLEQYAQKYSIPFFELDESVGGRFSVFSVVGLLPLALVGVDIANMLKGAQKVYRSFFNKKRSYRLLMEKARFMVENKHRFRINVLFSYSSALESFNRWYVQLWAESLGKVNKHGTRQGLTPIGLIGPVDQHSFLQLIMEGVRDKTVTFIKVEDFEESIFIPKASPIKELDYLEEISFSALIDMQAEATIEAVRGEKDIPLDIITIDKVDEYNIAELMYSCELLVSIIGAFLQINTYNQPGVESGKKILKSFLKNKRRDNN